MPLQRYSLSGVVLGRRVWAVIHAFTAVGPDTGLLRTVEHAIHGAEAESVAEQAKCQFLEIVDRMPSQQ
jgi:hypothetical protein